MPTVTVERTTVASTVLFYDSETLNIPTPLYAQYVTPTNADDISIPESFTALVITSWDQNGVMCTDVSAHVQ